MKQVDLDCAYVWDCDECGVENFVRAVVVEFTPDEVATQMEEYGGEEEDWQTGEWMTRPEQVTCGKCGATFETVQDQP